jgi:Protein of unknown function (DUF998)
MTLLPKLILATGAMSLLCLLLLHFLSPEYDASWRMISEYAMGKYKGVLTAFFVLSGVCTMMLPFVLWNETAGLWPKIGLVLVFLSGVGSLMGGLFDLKHPLHGAAFAIGVPTIMIGALLVTYHLVKQSDWAQYATETLVSAHAIWISLVLMGVSMIVMMNGFKQAGVTMGPDATPPDAVPAGVIAVAGYFNRLLVICNTAWVMLMAYVYMILRH